MIKIRKFGFVRALIINIIAAGVMVYSAATDKSCDTTTALDTIGGLMIPVFLLGFIIMVLSVCNKERPERSVLFCILVILLNLILGGTAFIVSIGFGLRCLTF